MTKYRVNQQTQHDTQFLRGVKCSVCRLYKPGALAFLSFTSISTMLYTDRGTACTGLSVARVQDMTCSLYLVCPQTSKGLHKSHTCRQFSAEPLTLNFLCSISIMPVLHQATPRRLRGIVSYVRLQSRQLFLLWKQKTDTSLTPAS